MKSAIPEADSLQVTLGTLTEAAKTSHTRNCILSSYSVRRQCCPGCERKHLHIGIAAGCFDEQKVEFNLLSLSVYSTMTQLSSAWHMRAVSIVKSVL